MQYATWRVFFIEPPALGCSVIGEPGPWVVCFPVMWPFPGDNFLVVDVVVALAKVPWHTVQLRRVYLRPALWLRHTPASERYLYDLSWPEIHLTASNRLYPFTLFSLLPHSRVHVLKSPATTFEIHPLTSRTRLSNVPSNSDNMGLDEE